MLLKWSATFHIYSRIFLSPYWKMITPVFCMYGAKIYWWFLPRGENTQKDHNWEIMRHRECDSEANETGLRHLRWRAAHLNVEFHLESLHTPIVWYNFFIEWDIFTLRFVFIPFPCARTCNSLLLGDCVRYSVGIISFLTSFFLPQGATHHLNALRDCARSVWSVQLHKRRRIYWGATHDHFARVCYFFLFPIINICKLIKHARNETPLICSVVQ